MGVFASYLLVWEREGKIIPWTKILLGLLAALALLAVLTFFAVQHYHLHVIRHWPFLTK